MVELSKVTQDEIPNFYRNLYLPYMASLKKYDCYEEMTQGQMNFALSFSEMKAYIITDDGDDVGLVMTEKVEERLSRPMLFIAEFGVMKEYRRCGIGRAAFSKILEMTDIPIFLMVLAKNRPAAAFWRKMVESNHLNYIQPELSQAKYAGTSTLFCVEKRSETPDRFKGAAAMPVEDLGLSMRSLNCLRRKGIERVGQILDLSCDEAEAIRNFGAKSRDEVREKLAENGLWVNW